MKMEQIINIPNLECFCVIYRELIPFHEIYNILREDCVKRFPITVWSNETLTPRTNCFYADNDINAMKYSTTLIPKIP